MAEQLLRSGGRPLADEAVLATALSLVVSLGLPGGKGGFGSMLRAMGAQKSGKETDSTWLLQCRTV